jgi:hypothetical protein
MLDVQWLLGQCLGLSAARRAAYPLFGFASAIGSWIRNKVRPGLDSNSIDPPCCEM